MRPFDGVAEGGLSAREAAALTQQEAAARARVSLRGPAEPDRKPFDGGRVVSDRLFPALPRLEIAVGALIGLLSFVSAGSFNWPVFTVGLMLFGAGHVLLGFELLSNRAHDRCTLTSGSTGERERLPDR